MSPRGGGGIEVFYFGKPEALLVRLEPPARAL